MSEVNFSLDTYTGNPPKFVREVLGNAPKFDAKGMQIAGNFPKQDEILMSVVKNKRTVVRAPNGVGKSISAAELILWGTSMFKDCTVITTAGSGRQVYSLWLEVNRMYSRSLVPLGGDILQTAIRFNKLGSYGYGFSTNKPEKFEGWHAKRILVIIDEAKIVPQNIFDASERLLTSGDWVRQLVISSPGSPLGPFYECFSKFSDLYHPIHIKMGESPYVDPAQIELLKRKYGETSPFYLSTVMGEFSSADDPLVVIPLTFVQKMVEDPPEWDKSRGACAGIDLAAGGGDECAYSLTVGNRQMALRRWKEPNTMESAGRIIRYFQHDAKKYGLVPEGVNIDDGSMGWAICDRLDELGYHFNRFNFGGSPIDGIAYHDAGAEVWYEARLKLQAGEVGLIQMPDPNDPDPEEGYLSVADLQNQLTGRKRIPRSDGRIQLEPKKVMKKRGLPSPDLADAFLLSCAGRRNVELNMYNTPSGGDDEKPVFNREDFLKDHYKKAQEIADQITAEREANG